MLHALLAASLAASVTFGPKDVQPLLQSGDEDGWAKVGYLGEAPDGKVALVFEQGEATLGHELKVRFAVVDSTGRTGDEQLDWSTTDEKRMDPVHAWEDLGSQLHTLLTRLGVRVGFKRFTDEPLRQPAGLKLDFETDPADTGPIVARLKGQVWFRTAPVHAPRLEWRGVLSTSKGALHFFALERLGAGAGPSWAFLARALPPAPR